MITTTQTTEAKKKKKMMKRIGPAVSVDTTMVRSDVETINIEKEEDDVKSPDMATMPPRRRLARSPQQRSGCWRHPARSS
jgi:hypothetical protein